MSSIAILFRIIRLVYLQYINDFIVLYPGKFIAFQPKMTKKDKKRHRRDEIPKKEKQKLWKPAQVQKWCVSGAACLGTSEGVTNLVWRKKPQRSLHVSTILCGSYFVPPKTVTHRKFCRRVTKLSTNIMYDSTERNQGEDFEQSGSNDQAKTEDAIEVQNEVLESTFTIECIDPNIEPTEEILALFDSEGDAEYNNVTIFGPATLLEPPVPENL